MRKFLSVTLAVIMLTMLIVPSLSLVTFAASSHSHPVCGDICTHTNGGTTRGHEDETWTEWDGKTRLRGGKNYYISKDIKFSSTTIIDSYYTDSDTTVRLCLNGHSITCEDTVFNIYSESWLEITDCVGTGVVETLDTDEAYYPDTIICARGFILRNGTIKNSNEFGAAYYGGTYDVPSYAHIYGGRLEGSTGAYIADGATLNVDGGEIYGNRFEGIEVLQPSKLYVKGGNISGVQTAVSGQGSSTSTTASVFEMTGGTLTACEYGTAINLFNCSVKITGGTVDGQISLYSSIVATTHTISGGTYTGSMWLEGKGKATISNIEIPEILDLNMNTTINSVTVKGYYTTIGGAFTENLEVSINGGTFENEIKLYSGALYLSGSPDIDRLDIYRLDTTSVSAKNKNGTSSYSGDPINIRLETHVTTDIVDEVPWKNGDVIVSNVTSDALAAKFVYEPTYPESYYPEIYYAERSGNNLIYRVDPHGTDGGITWKIEDGTLTISGEGKIPYGYDWLDFTDMIEKIVIEPGITNIPYGAFAKCDLAESISIPNTVTEVDFTAFTDCASINNILIPASVEEIYGNCKYNTNSAGEAYNKKNYIFGCDSLSAIYYEGTSGEWDVITDGYVVTNYERYMSKNFLSYYDTTATCVSSGNQAYYKFLNTSVYNYLYDENKNRISEIQTVPALGHDVGEWYEYKAPGCAEVGYERADCSRCSYYETREVAANGHSYTASVTAPTCTDKGYTTYTCACGDSYVADEVKENGHSYDAVVTEPTCTEGGYTTYTCTVCGDSYVGDRVPVRHNYNAVVTAPTCTEGGYTTYTCACGDSYVGDEVKANGHSYEASVTAPTCTEGGYTTYTCSVCGDNYTEDEINALGHTEVTDEAVAPDCTETGLTEGSHCGVCGEVIVAQGVVPALDHDYIFHEGKKETCTEDGWDDYYTCGREGCDYSTYSDNVALGHLFLDYVSNNDATCTEDGTKTAVCVRCDATDTVIDDGSKLPHADEDEDFFCDDCGSKVDRCKLCGQREHTTHIATVVCILKTFIRLMISFIKSLVA